MDRVLSIDDDRELSILIRQSIRSENIEADCCSDGKAGLATEIGRASCRERVSHQV